MAKVVGKLFTTMRELAGEKQIEVRSDTIAKIIEHACMHDAVIAIFPPVGGR